MNNSVLLIENNADAADALQRLLEIVGLDIRVVRNGADGLEEARRWLPAVILSDLGLARLSGFEIAAALRQDSRTAGIRLIAVSAYSDPESVRKAKECGFEHVIAKPADPIALIALVSENS